eukprot:403360284
MMKDQSQVSSEVENLNSMNITLRRIVDIQAYESNKLHDELLNVTDHLRKLNSKEERLNKAIAEEKENLPATYNSKAIQNQLQENQKKYQELKQLNNIQAMDYARGTPTVSQFLEMMKDQSQVSSEVENLNSMNITLRRIVDIQANESNKLHDELLNVTDHLRKLNSKEERLNKAIAEEKENLPATYNSKAIQNQLQDNQKKCQELKQLNNIQAMDQARGYNAQFLNQMQPNITTIDQLNEQLKKAQAENNFYMSTFGFEMQELPNTERQEYKILMKTGEDNTELNQESVEVLVDRMKLIQLYKERATIESLKLIPEKNPSKKLTSYRMKFLHLLENQMLSKIE